MTENQLSLLGWQMWFSAPVLEAIDEAASKYRTEISLESFPPQAAIRSLDFGAVRSPIVPIAAEGKRLKETLQDLGATAQALAETQSRLDRLSPIAVAAIFEEAAVESEIFGQFEIDELRAVLGRLEQRCRDAVARLQDSHSPTAGTGQGSNSSLGRESEYRAIPMPEAEFAPRLRLFRHPKDKFAIRVLLALFIHEIASRCALEATTSDLGQFLTSVWNARIGNDKPSWDRVLRYRGDIVDCSSRMRGSAALWESIRTDLR